MPSGLTYTLDNLRTDIRGYTEVGDTVFSDTVLNKFIQSVAKFYQHTKF